MSYLIEFAVAATDKEILGVVDPITIVSPEAGVRARSQLIVALHEVMVSQVGFPDDVVFASSEGC